MARSSVNFEPMILIWRLGLLFLLVAISDAQANSPGATDPRSEFVVDVWTTDDGLPQNSVNSICQAPNGYLWMGTFDGLVRFDGVRFTVFNPENSPGLPGARILVVLAARNGDIWTVSEGGDLCRYSQGIFHAYTAADGLPPVGAGTVCETPDGSIWAGAYRGGGCYRLDNGRFTNAIPLDPADPILYRQLTSDRNGELWQGRNTRLMHLFPGPPRFVEVRFGDASGPIKSWCPSRLGGIWVSAINGVQRIDSGGVREVRRSQADVESSAYVCEDTGGNVWVGTWNTGLFRYGPNGEFEQFRLTDSLTPESIRAVCEDTEGDLWVGTDGAGLFRFRRKIFRSFGSREGLSSKAIRSIAEDTVGRIWVVSQAGIDWISNQPPYVVTHPVAQPVNTSWVVMPDARGGMWIAGAGTGLYRYLDGRIRAIDPAKHVLHALFQDRDGAVFYGGDGVFLQTDGESVMRPAGSGLPGENPSVRAIARDRRGVIYLGLQREGLLRGERGKWTRLGITNGLAEDRVWALHTDRDDILWIGTANGLSRFKDGHFFNVGVSGGMPKSIGSILEDDQGFLWLGTDRGIYRLNRREFNDFADGRSGRPVPVIYDRGDGVATMECSIGRQPGAWKDHEGKLWFATVQGVSMTDPKRAATNSIPPPVLMEGVVMDEPAGLRRAEAGGDGAIRAAAGTRRLNFHFTALSFAAPNKARFRYRLDGVDPDWVDGGVQREAQYSRLGPGTYHFQVTACNQDGVWNQRGADLAVVVEPYFWERIWFKIALVSLAAGVLGLAARQIALRRFRAQLAELERQRSVDQERRRIARDMHDDVGASLTQIGLLSELARGNTSDPRRVQTQLNQLSVLTREVVGRFDELVWATNPVNDTVEKLVEYLAQFATGFLATGGIQCRLDIPALLPSTPLDAATRHHVFMVIRESLNNTLKYSRATEVQFQARIKPGGVRLTLTDNGCGFDPAKSAGKGDGLGNMPRRMAGLGGTCEIRSEPGKGTSVALFVPVPGVE